MLSSFRWLYLVKTMFQVKRQKQVSRWNEEIHKDRGLCMAKAQKYSFKKKILEDASPFCGTTDTPTLDFW